jgi:hypothetical protein
MNEDENAEMKQARFPYFILHHSPFFFPILPRLPNFS